MRRLCATAICLGLFLGACGGDTPEQAVPTPTALPSEEEIVAAFLTADEIGPDLEGEPPTAGDPEGVTIAKPLCGIKLPEDLISMQAFFRTADASPLQVFERISIFEPDDAELAVARTRERAAARCTRREGTDELSYRMTVEGPIELPALADEVAGLEQSYSRGYDGHRWAMLARSGRVTVYIEYTTPDPIDPARAEEIFRAAVDKASSLA